MSILAIKFDDCAVEVSSTKNALHFVIADGREISAPPEEEVDNMAYCGLGAPLAFSSSSHTFRTWYGIVFPGK